MSLKILFSLCLVWVLAGTVSAQPILKAEGGPFLLMNATIHPITSADIQGDLYIQDGKIQAIGTNLQIADETQRIDCAGMHIYPGMIDAGTTLGLGEVGSVSLTQDANEIGDLTPHVRALTAVNPNSTLIPVTRVSGVTSVLTKPTGGLFPGTASVINLQGYTPNQMHTGVDIMIMNFPSSGRRGRWDRRSDEDIKKSLEKNLKSLNMAWEQAIAYHKVDSAANAMNKSANTTYNPEMEALVKVVRGEMSLHIEVNKESDIKAALKWIKDNNVKNAVLTGVTDGWRVAEDIAKANIPVITGPVQAIPGRASDRYDVAYANAGKMANAGVKVAIRSDDSENVRNLPYHAGFAVAYGMKPSDALKSVTITSAEILGIDEMMGSLENGKVANIMVTDGDPFETKTTVHYVFIDGWKIPMDSRHIRLYNEFLDRKPGLRE